jgi:hypothetical protein
LVQDLVNPSEQRPNHRRRRVTGGLGALVVFALVLTACLPPPPPPPPPTQDCLDHAPATAADYQTLFQRRSTYWEGADTTAVVGLPGQPTTWLFGDTLVGRVQPDGSAQSDSGFSNSSAITESGACITTHLGWYGTSIFTNPTDGSWYWPGGAVARADGSVDVMLTQMRSTDAAPPLNFVAVGMAVAHVNPDMSVASITPLAQSLVTGDDGNGNSEVRNYGGSVATDGTYAYLYTFVPASVFGIPVRLDQYVARVPLAGSLTSGWQYSTCAVHLAPGLPCPIRTWTSDPSASRPMDIDPDATVAVTDAPIAAFHVTSYGSGYLAVAKSVDLPSTNAADNRVLAWTSQSPAGPWTSIGQIGEATPSTAKGAWTYGARLLDTPQAGWVLTWNANADSDAVHANVRLYGPQFATPDGLPAG